MRIVAAVFCARTAFNLCLASIVRCFSAENQTAPIARLALSLGSIRREDNGRVFRALRDEFSTALHDDGRHSLLVAFDDGSRLDGQFGTVSHIHPSFQQISSFLQGLLAREDELLVAVADLVVVEKQVVGRFQAAVGGPMARVGCRYGVVVAA